MANKRYFVYDEDCNDDDFCAFVTSMPYFRHELNSVELNTAQNMVNYSIK